MESTNFWIEPIILKKLLKENHISLTSELLDLIEYSYFYDLSNWLCSTGVENTTEYLIASNNLFNLYLLRDSNLLEYSMSLLDCLDDEIQCCDGRLPPDNPYSTLLEKYLTSHCSAIDYTKLMQKVNEESN